MQRLKQIYDLYDFSFTDTDVKNETEKILSEHRAENDTPEVRRRIISLIDLTSLSPLDNYDTITRLAERANSLATPVAALCVYPAMVAAARQALTRTETKIASVAGGFPHSQTFAEVKIAEVSLAVAAGADEIDIVLPVGQFVAGNHSDPFDEINELKAAARTAQLKVILETGAMRSYAEIKQASLLAMAAGADFIKTSTGKYQTGVKPEDVTVMCHAIREFHDKTGDRVGIKVAGGIRTPEQAIDYYTIVSSILGPDWLTPRLFRFGATSLLDTLI